MEFHVLILFAPAPNKFGLHLNAVNSIFCAGTGLVT